MRIAIAQMQVAPLDVPANVKRTVEALEHLSPGVDLMVLPELVTTGYVLDREKLRVAAEPADRSGLAIASWAAAARRHHTAIVAGFAESDGEHLYDASVLIDSEGQVVGTYRKLHLFGAEREVFDEGDLGFPVFDVGDVRLGMLICYDLRFPEAVRILGLEGAEVVAVPTAWVRGFDRPSAQGNGHVGQVDGALVQANLNQVFVACASQTGATDDYLFLGRSVVVSPYGEAVLGPLSPDAEEVSDVVIDVAEVTMAQERGPGISPRRNRRADVYGHLLGYQPRHGGRRHQGENRTEDLLNDMRRRRGYLLDIHRLLAEWDPYFLQAYDDFLDAAFLRGRSLLDRRTKELIYVGVLTALASPREHLVNHMRAALDNGVTPAELLSVLEQVLPPAGVARFIEGMDAFKEVCGSAPSSASGG